MLENTKIEEIWILSKAGITLFNQRTDNKEDPARAQLVGGFISALHSFSEKMDLGEFKCMDMGKHRICFIFAKEYALIFVGLADAKVKEKNVVESVKKIKELFLNTFKKELSQDIDEISLFENAKDSISVKMQDWLGVKIDAGQSKKILDKL